MTRKAAFSGVLLLTFLPLFPLGAESPALLAMEREDRALLANSKVQAFMGALLADKIQITQGKLYKPDVLQLTCTGVLTSCNGFNSSNPYLVVSVPRPGEPYDLNDPPLFFAMRQDEAIVLIGRTPPPLAYSSFRSFIFSRYVEREGVRRKVFPSLGDPNNMSTVNTLGRAKGDPYNRAFVLMIVSDRGTESRVRKALNLAGYPDAIINKDVISPNIARMSSKANGDVDEMKDDGFAFLQRFALWDYGWEKEGEEYLTNPPVTVLRLTPNPRTEKASYDPLPVEKLRPRGTGMTELDLLPEVDALRDAIVARYPEMKAVDIPPTTWLEESFVAIQKDLDVLGESRDTVYLRNEGTFSLADDEFVMIYGVNHEKTGKSTYANFAAYHVCTACPYAGENSRRVAGSALGYFPSAESRPKHIDSLYAWKLARNCAGDPHCTELHSGNTGDPVKDCMAGIPKDGQIFIGFRAYVEPATKVGPAFSELVYDRVTRFTPAVPVISNVTLTNTATGAVGTVFPVGTTVEIKFDLAADSAASDVTFTATLKADDGCAELVPASKTQNVKEQPKGSVLLKVPVGQKATLTVFLNATDSKGRRAKTVGVQAIFQ